MIQTSLSYKLNPQLWETFGRARQHMAEVMGMIKRLNTAESLIVSSDMKREDVIGKRTGGLDDLLLGGIDETLKHVFRKEGTKVIYNYLENKCHLKRKDITKKTEVFSASLERLLGSAAPVIERMILENLYSKLGLKLEEKEGCGFSDYLKELKEKYRC